MSPFDDEPTEAQATPAPGRRRVKRPWWKWNLIVLAVTLFVLVWVRTILKWSPESTFLGIFTIGSIWAILPAILEPNWISTMSPAPMNPTPQKNETSLPAQLTIANVILVVFKLLGLVFAAISIFHFVAIIWIWVGELSSTSGGFSRAFGGRTGGMWIFSIGMIFVQPMLEFIAAASLYVLAEIALRLDRR